MTRWPMVSTWQSLDRIERSTLNESCATVARMPATLLAEIATPIPVPQNRIARSASPFAMRVAASMATLGYVLAPGSSGCTPRSVRTATRGFDRRSAAMASL